MKYHCITVGLAVFNHIATATVTTQLEARQATGANPAAGYTYAGCYSDGVSGRVLGAAAFASSNMTNANCISFCFSRNYPYAGTEYSAECFCGQDLGAAALYQDDCNMPCSGDISQSCGGPNRLSVYANFNIPRPSTNPGVNGYTYQGCYVDSVNARTLPYLISIFGGAAAMSVSECTNACFENKFVLAGLEHSGECWCGTTFLSPTYLLPGTPYQTGCSNLCLGNTTEFCGGPNRMDLYSYTPLEAISNGDFEAGSYPWVTQGTNPGFEKGDLQAVIYEATTPEENYSFGNGSLGLRIDDPGFGDGNDAGDGSGEGFVPDVASVCIGQQISLPKVGTYNFSAVVGRITSTSAPVTVNDLQFEVVLRHYTNNGLKDYRTVAPREVCSEANPAHLCTLGAMNGRVVYESVSFGVPIVRERVGYYIVYFCGIFNGTTSGSHVLLADRLSLLGPILG